MLSPSVLSTLTAFSSALAKDISELVLLNPMIILSLQLRWPVNILRLIHFLPLVGKIPHAPEFFLLVSFSGPSYCLIFGHQSTWGSLLRIFTCTHSLSDLIQSVAFKCHLDDTSSCYLYVRSSPKIHTHVSNDLSSLILCLLDTSSSTYPKLYSRSLSPNLSATAFPTLLHGNSSFPLAM